MTLHVDPTVVLPPFQSSMENHCQFSTFSAHSAGRAAGGALITLLLLLSDDRFPALNGGAARASSRDPHGAIRTNSHY